MRYPLILLFAVFFCTCVRAQLTIAPNGTLTVLPQRGPTDYVTVDGKLAVYTFGVLDLRGRIDVKGNIELGGTLELQLNGEEPGTEAPSLTATGSIFPAGTLNVTLGDGYAPSGRIDYLFASSPDVFGRFSGENLPDADWSVAYNSTNLTLRLDKLPPAFDLAGFFGENSGRDIALGWSTTRELGSDYFAVERFEGTWTEIGRVAAAGDDADGRGYNFRDRDLAGRPSVSYRLRMVALDGRITYSNIIEVTRIIYQTDDVLVVNAGATLYVSRGAFVVALGKDILIQPGSEVTNLSLIRTDLDLLLSGTYRTTLNGSFPIFTYGYLLAGNRAVIDAELEVDLAADYTPTGEIVYTLVAADQRTGTFIEPATLPAGDWQTEYTPTEANLVTGRGAPAPVDWLTFTAEPRGAEVDLKWTTAREENSDYFGVERQDENGQWNEIGRVAAMGFSTDETPYDFTDTAPGRRDPIYYRLRQVDFDGTIDYSAIVSVRLPLSGGLTLYPNPTTRSIFLAGEVPDRTYRITDVNGRTVLTGTLAEGPRPRIDLPASLATGVYYLRFGTEGGRSFQVVR